MPERPANDGAPPDPLPPRRGFLRALALGPAALAVGCAGSRAAGPGATAAAPAEAQPAGAEGRAPQPSPPGSGDEDPLAAIRRHPLPMDAEPAFVFRAAAARPGE
jgi:hypothetical protein